VSYEDVEKVIHLFASQHKIERQGAFVTLPGKEHLAKERISRSMISEQKYKRTLRAASLLRVVPYIRMIGVCNTLAFDMARREGDMDLFIIAKKNRLYVVRWLVTLLMQVFGFRRHKLKISDRICLSFYVDEEGMDMSRFELDGDDPYLAVWTSRIIPIFSSRGTYEHFWKINEQWISSYLQHPAPYDIADRRKLPDTGILVAKRKILEILFWPFVGSLEYFLRAMQRSRLQRGAQRHVRLTPTGVVIDDHTLKFHEEDRRILYRERMRTGSKAIINTTNP
jgi:hypothetical protein